MKAIGLVAFDYIVLSEKSKYLQTADSVVHISVNPLESGEGVEYFDGTQPLSLSLDCLLSLLD